MVSTAVRADAGRGCRSVQGAAVSDPAELLARLTIHGPALDGANIRATDPDRLTVADIGHAMGMGLSREQARLLWAKYCDDVAEQGMFKAEFFMWVMDQARDWARPKPGMVYGLAYRAADEFLSANRCPACKGASQRLIGDLAASCATCEGTGYRYPTEQDYAKAIGCTLPAYRAVWAGRTALCRRELSRMEYAALARFAEVMADD